jgi:hypothetical protein
MIAPIYFDGKMESRRKATLSTSLLLGGRRTCADNVSRKRQALAAFRLATKSCVNIVGTLRPAAHGGAQILFPDGITHANNHRFAPDSLFLPLMRIDCNSFNAEVVALLREQVSAIAIRAAHSETAPARVSTTKASVTMRRVRMPIARRG